MRWQHLPRRAAWTSLAVLGSVALIVLSLPLAQLVMADPPENTLPVEKQALETQYATERAGAYRAPKNPPPDAATLQQQSFAPQQDMDREAGIIQHSQAPFPTHELTIVNQWQHMVNGEWAQVYAGALAEDAQQGVVIFQREPRDGSTEVVEQYLTPAKAGALRITDARGFLLTLKSADGATFTFDVLTRTLLPVENAG